MKRGLLVFAMSVLCISNTTAQEPYSPPVARDYPVRAFWGDTHVHTALSGDAFNGNTRLGLDEAYRFARGEKVLSNTGQPVQLDRPLDFLVIADHGNNIGAAYARHYFAEDPAFRRSATGRMWEKALAELQQNEEIDRKALVKGPLLPAHRTNQISVRHPGFRETIWHQITATAERYNDPGRFTTLIGYEWTPSGQLGGADHRVVVFKDGSETVDRVLPFTSFDSSREEDLWAFLVGYEAETGGNVMAIPHNSNLTGGRMFSLVDSYGKPFDAKYSRVRARWEPLVEVTQIKGDSETHPFLSPDDEFADYETWNGWGGRENGGMTHSGRRAAIRENEKIQYEYARSALKLGLGVQADTGANPFKFGLIGSSDSHTALSAMAEDNFWGKNALAEPSARRIFNPGAVMNWQMAAAGYVAVWATENTRDAIFSAMKRRETYATTGPRMTVRFFGSWDYAEDDAQRRNLAEIGYAKGVPMGGDLSHAPAGRAPTFLIRSVKDPDGANLDRVQVIKGWRDNEGGLHERIFNVALSDGRAPDANGKAPAVGNTVDVEDASYTNIIGDPELAVVWEDPDFDPAEYAFYYLRVIEIPTPRWTAYDAKHYGLENLPSEIPMITQERAYTSPIWYTPD